MMDGSLFPFAELPPAVALDDGLIVDSFAGGGGASLGIAMALGRGPDIAINHDPAAMAMHAANHPESRHLSKNIWQVDPLDAVGTRPVALAWFSPDCKHFSKAKGGKPVSRSIRDLGWVVVNWAKRARPHILFVENVEEFQDWGPVGADGKPCKDRKGETFKRWVRELRRLGYAVEWRVSRACDYGAPTIRKRLLIIARRDGEPIVWPKPTHAAPDDPRVTAEELKPWRTAAEIIDWSIPCPSIFDTSETIFEQYGVRAKRPLAENTLKRIARGIQRYVLDDPAPFIVKFQSGSTGHDIDDPLATVTANSFHKKPGGAAPIGVVAPVFGSIAHGDSGGRRAYSAKEPFRTVTSGGIAEAVIAPSLYNITHSGRNEPITEPLRTITCAHRGEKALLAPTLIQTGYGERNDQAPRVPGLDKPLGTTVAGGCKHALVAAFLAQHNLARGDGVHPGRPVDAPLSTVTATGSQQSIVAAHLINQKGTAQACQGVGEPVPTVCAGTVHAGLVAAFMTKYYGTDQAPEMQEPLHTATAKDRFGLVTVEIAGATYAIVDIGLRMLTPRELYRAQGFPDSYVIDRDLDGNAFSKSVQIEKVGNSVSPPWAAAHVAANCGWLS